MEVAITIENAANFGAGTQVEFNFGAYYAPVTGTVTRIEYLPATKFFPAQARLWAEYMDEDGEFVETTITRFSEKGIGTRLVSAVAEPKNESKWAGLRPDTKPQTGDRHMPTFPQIECRKCASLNPIVYFAPVVTARAGTCICYDCAKARQWLDRDGNLKDGITL